MSKKFSKSPLFYGFDYVITEAAVIERIRRHDPNILHPQLQIAPLIYSLRGQELLRAIYEEYILIAKEANLPIVLCTPTWRADQMRVKHSEFSLNINEDAGEFMQSIRRSYPDTCIYIGGLMGVCNDCYKPEQALDVNTSASFHNWQADRLANSGVDFLYAATIPSLSEARGMARALARTDLPYAISFTLGADGNLLDGTAPSMAFGIIDEDQADHPPLGYMFNCCYPTFLKCELLNESLITRVLGFQANGSSVDPRQLDHSVNLQTELPARWASDLANFYKQTSAKLLGGCCGTDGRHLRSLIKSLK